MKNLFMILTIMVALIFMATSSAKAGSGTWSGASGTQSWASGSNWSTNPTPPGSTSSTTSTDVATFNTTAGSTITIDSGRNIGELSFTGAAGSYTIGSAGANGGNALLLSSSAGNVLAFSSGTTSSDQTETINAPLVLEPASATTAGTEMFVNNSASDSFNIAGGISGGTTSSSITLTLAGSNEQSNTISGSISDGGAAPSSGGLGLSVVKASSAGTWVLSGANTYSGGTTINGGGGLLIANNSTGSAFGTGTVVLANGALLAAGSNNPTENNNFTLQGGTSAGAAFVGSNSLTITGTTTFANTQAMFFTNNSTGLLTFGNVVLNAQQGTNAATLAGTGNTTINGIVSDGGASGFIDGDSGTLTLSGHATSTGSWILEAGTVVMDFTSDSGTKVGSGGLTLGGVNLQLKAGSGTENVGNVSFGTNGATGGQFNLTRTSGSETLTMGTITLAFGTSAAAPITANFQSGIATTTSTTTNTTNSAASLLGNEAFAVVGSAGAADWAATTSGGSIVGYTTVNSYTALASGANASTGNNYLVTDSLTTSQTGLNTLKIVTSSSTAQTLTLSNGLALGLYGGILDSASGNYTITGSFMTLGSNGTTIQQYGGGTLEIDSQILGSNNSLYFQKGGPGTLILGGTNAWKQTLSINQGIVSASSDSNLGGVSGSVVVASSTSGSTAVTLANPAPATLVVGSSFLGNTITAISGTSVTLASGGANVTISSNTSEPYAIGASIALDGGTLEATGTFSLSETGATTINRGIILGADGGTIDVAPGNTLTEPGVISNLSNQGFWNSAHAALTKTDTGTLILSGADTYNGGTNVNGGTLKLGIATALGTASGTNPVAVNTGGTLDIGGFSPSVGPLILAGGTITNSGGAATVKANSYDFRGGQASAVLADGANPSTLTKSTSGTVVLSGANTYTGGTLINAGTVEFMTPTSMPATGTVAAASGSTLAIAAGGAGQFSNATSGAGSIGGIFAGVGGQTGSVVALAAGSAVGIDTTGGSVSYGGTIANAGIGLTKLGSNSLALTASNSYSGGTTVSSGTLYANTAYTTPGAASSTGTGGVNVSSGATLAGSGTIAPTNTNASANGGVGVTLNSGSSLSSGGSQAASTGAVIGTGMTLDNTAGLTNILAVNSANLTFALGSGGSAAPYAYGTPNMNSTYMKVIGNTAGEISFTGTNSISIVDLTGGALTLRQGTPYLLIQAGSSSDYSGLVTEQGFGPTATYSLDGTGYVVGVAGPGWTSADGATIDVTPITINQYGPDGVTPLSGSNVYAAPALYLAGGDLEVVPEPGTWALMLGGLAVLVLIQRRKNKLS